MVRDTKVADRREVYRGVNLAVGLLLVMAGCGETTSNRDADHRQRVAADIGGLPSLVSVSSMAIAGNAKLPQCEVDEIASRIGGCTYRMDNGSTGTCD